ncbi:MAG: twin-arginine translocase subunit TatB [Nitrospinae bacterium]|nr:twin-arginine translocase subunit TatB [Nitrospinota bacterium]
MFGSIGMTELLVILVVALLVIGPKKLPNLARTIGRTLRDFKRATSDFENSIDIETDEEYDDSDITTQKKNKKNEETINSDKKE